MANKDDPTDPLRRQLLAAGSLLSAAAAFWPRLSLASTHPEGNPMNADLILFNGQFHTCLLYTSPSPRDLSTSRMPSSA